MTNKNLFSIFIILAALIAGLGVYSIRQKDSIVPDKEPEKKVSQITISPVTDNDQMLGNPSAPVIFVEYSDYQCPFCKQFHDTMQRLMTEYAKDGKLAWVYRHFPIQDSHPNAYSSALASLCVNKIGGNVKFWEFSDLVFEGSPDSALPSEIKKIISGIGIPEAEFDTCVSSNEFKPTIENNIADGMKLYENDPAFGTPYIIVITKNGLIPISGSQPYSVLKEIIDKNI